MEQYSNIQEKEIHLRDYMRVILKRKRIVLTFFFITVIVVFLGTLQATPMYTASLKLTIEKKSQDPLRQIYRYSHYDPEFIGSQTQIITSRAVAEKVVNMLDLVENYKHFFPEEEQKRSFLGAIGQMVGSWLASGDEEETEGLPWGKTSLPRELIQQEMTPEEMMAVTIAEELSVEPIRESNILVVSYTSRNPEFSALICNTIPKAYVEQLLEMRMTDTEYTLEWMRKKADSEREKLEQSEQRLQEYLKSQDIVTIEDRITIIPERLSQLSRKLTDIETAREELEVLVNKIERTPVSQLDSLPAVAEESSLQALRKQILDAEQEILKLNQKYGPKHPVLMQAKKNLKELREKKNAEAERIARKIENDYEMAMANEQNLRRQLEATKAEAARLNEKSVQYRILKREIDAKQQLYNALISRMKEQAMTKQTRTVSVAVVQKAEVPQAPSNQNAKRNILLAIILGTFGGIGLAFFLEYLDNTVSVVEDAEEKLGIPAMASIPYVEKMEQPERVVFEKPNSSYAEAYKSLRASLTLSTDRGLPRTLMIASISPDEGKTLTCANLAIAMARAGKSVLIVDSDLRRPKMHIVFGLSNDTGFSDLLTGNTDSLALIRSTEVENLDLLTSGKTPPNPSELLASENTKTIIKDISSRYDIVFFDSPPVSSVSDSIVLSDYVRKIILVVRSGVTRYEDVRHGIKKLMHNERKILGQVVNAVDMKKEGYYYYSSYYRNSGYYVEE
ncbi:MAG: polysaccharide biosynthesis tyrosine autokinase [Thermodesulfobacteriota bacterium]|nr:polysaccharide biosynthesis tyrosine autokinase [Thermodesulfobacteriota bacterium]